MTEAMQPPTVELDGQYRALREEAGFLDRSERGMLVVSGPGRRRVPPGPAHQRRRGAGSRSEGCYAALLDRKGHMQADMRVLRLSDEEIWLDTEPEAGRARRCATCGCTASAARSRSRTAASAWAILSLIGPAAVEAGRRRGPLRPSTPSASRAGRASRCSRVATDLGLDLITHEPSRRASSRRRCWPSPGPRG